MVTIWDRIRALPEEKKLSQGDFEKRTGLLYLPCRKLSYSSIDRNAGEVGPGVGTATLSTVL